MLRQLWRGSVATGRERRASQPARQGGSAVAYEPDLVPPLRLMRQEGIDVLEEWFRWGEEWSLLLRAFGQVGAASRVLEIGCGLGRTAFPLRYVIGPDGRYDGFEICRDKVEFLQRTFHRAHPRFNFTWADVHNTFYNPRGRTAASAYRFPYPDGRFDVVYAASVFTHLLPSAAARYVAEAARVLRPGGRGVFSFFLLDHYRPGQPRPYGFARAAFNFDHAIAPEHGADFAVGVPANPEEMTAYRLRLVEAFARQAGLELERPPLPGLWSGSSNTWVGAQDVVILRKP